jgi:hypothetical protein
MLGWGIGLFLLVALTLRFIDQNRPTISHLFLGLVSSFIYGGLNSLWDWTYPIDNE